MAEGKFVSGWENFIFISKKFTSDRKEIIFKICVLRFGVNYPLDNGSVGAAVAQAVWCLTTGWTIGRSRFDPRQGQRVFLLAPASRPALGPTQPPIQWVPGVLSPGVKLGQSVMLTTHSHLVAEVKYE
jgi:hypothetical protein